MKLLEFFGKALEFGSHDQTDQDKDKEYQLEPEERTQLETEIFEYILNNDDLHKKFFLPVAAKIDKKPTEVHHPKVWLPMVNKGCMEFYKENNMEGDPLDMFDKDFRGTLCKKFAEYHNKHILMGEYNLGN